MEHSSRSSFRLRGNVRDLFLPTTFCFPSLTHLDLSHISPWGHPFLHHRNPIIEDHQHLIAFLLRRAFPNISSLAFYTLQALAPLWPALRHAKLVRWHQRHSHHPHGADLALLLAACPSLAHLDISHFYCWAEDVPEALHAFSAAAASLTRLNLLSAAVLGFGASKLFRISVSCPNLRHLPALCVFDPRYIDSSATTLSSPSPRTAPASPSSTSPTLPQPDASLLAIAQGCSRHSIMGRAWPGMAWARHGPWPKMGHVLCRPEFFFNGPCLARPVNRHSPFIKGHSRHGPSFGAA